MSGRLFLLHENCVHGWKAVRVPRRHAVELKMTVNVALIVAEEAESELTRLTSSPRRVTVTVSYVRRMQRRGHR